jgi:hypothetical protein
MEKLSFSSAFCVKTLGLLSVKPTLSSYLPLRRLRGNLSSLYRKNTTPPVLVSLALFSLSCLPVHAQTAKATDVSWPSFTYSGGWNPGGSSTWTQDPNGVATFKFTGNAVDVYGEKVNQWETNFSLQIDSGAERNFNISGLSGTNIKVASISGLTDAPHTLKIKNKNGQGVLSFYHAIFYSGKLAPTPTPTLNSPFSSGLSVFNPNPFGYTAQQMLDKNWTDSNGVVHYTTFDGTPANVIPQRTEVTKWYAANGFDPTVYFWQQGSNPFPSGSTAQAADVVLGTVSTDSTFARKIENNALSFKLPVGYLGGGEVQTMDPNGGYGYAIGRVMARGTDPARTLTDSLGNVIQIKVPNDLRQDGGVGIPPSLPGADRTVIWYDQSTKSYRASWQTERAADGVNWKCAFVTGNLQLPLLGHEGAIAAARIPEMAGLILPGELTANRPIGHALKGPTSGDKNWYSGIVYPASDIDHYPGNNPTGGAGLLPYGARVRLPKSVDLTKMALSLPARRVLEAIQDYGWFVDDLGVRDMDIKTSVFNTEASAYPNYAKEVFDVIKANAMEIVLPSVKLK